MTFVYAGCDDSVNPFIEDDRFFTLFGFLDTASDLQAVRVVPLGNVIGQRASDIDAVVTTTEIESGRVVVWTDTVVDFADSSQGHVFRGAFRPVPGHSYRMDVVRGDGVSASATTVIPLATKIAIDQPTLGGTDVFQRVFWAEIPADPFRIEVWYRFMGVRPSDPFVDAVVTYQDTKFGRPSDGGWEVLVRLTEDRLKVAQLLSLSPDAGLTLLGIGARLTMSDNGWRPPDGIFDREVLVQPGTFSNVEGGFGFLGSVNQFTVEWTLTPEITERIGYSYPGISSD
jgi:hypothetical protein